MERNAALKDSNDFCFELNHEAAISVWDILLDFNSILQDLAIEINNAPLPEEPILSPTAQRASRSETNRGSSGTEGAITSPSKKAFAQWITIFSLAINDVKSKNEQLERDLKLLFTRLRTPAVQPEGDAPPSLRLTQSDEHEVHCLNVEYAELSDDVDTAYKSLDEFIAEISTSLTEHMRDLESAKKSKSSARFFTIGTTVAGVTASVFMPYASILALSLLGGGASGSWFYSK